MTHIHQASRFALISQWFSNFATHGVTWRAWLPWIPGTLVQRVWGEEAGSALFLPGSQLRLMCRPPAPTLGT